MLLELWLVKRPHILIELFSLRAMFYHYGFQFNRIFFFLYIFKSNCYQYRVPKNFDPVLQVGLISDERLVDLLDLALSADTVNTVKNLRVIMESGVEPLALMSQLATVITDILAGCYDYTKEGRRRKFFRHQPCESESLIEQSICLISQKKKKNFQAHGGNVHIHCQIMYLLYHL